MKRALIASILVLFLIACSSESKTGTAPVTVPSASATPEPARLPTSTPTIAFTSTPILSPTPAPLLSLKVLSYNVLYGAGVDRQFDEDLKASKQYDQYGKNRLPDLIAFIKQVNPDIVGIQEGAGWDRGTPSVVQKVAEELGMNYFLAKTSNELNDILLSKFKITQAENISSEIGNVGALRAVLTTPDGQPLNVFIVHLDPSSQIVRMCEVNSLIQQMQPFFAQRTVLLGDMNSNSSSREFSKLEQAGLQSVAVANYLGIDQIWVAPGANWSTTPWFQSFQRPVDVSDHHPIGAEIKFLPMTSTIPTITPLPPTPTVAAPLVVSDSLTNIKVVRMDRFDDTCSQSKWNSSWTTEKIENGVLEVGGEEAWEGGVSRLKEFKEGQGIVLRFQFAKGTEANLFFDSSKWNTDPHRRFGINILNNKVLTDAYQGKTGIGDKVLVGNLRPLPDTWYNLMIVITKDGELFETIWDPSNPAQIMRYREKFGDKWAGLTWRFSTGANRGKLLIDDFIEFSFSDIK